MCKKHFITQAVPGIATLCKPSGHSHYYRSRKFIGRSPADGSDVFELFRGGIGIFSKLYFCHRHQSAEGQPCCPAYNTFFRKAGIETTRLTTTIFKSLS